jgi:hypothetical protein
MRLCIAVSLISMSGTYTTFFKYIVLAAVIVLLAPYAGCHILTTPPSDTLNDAHNQPSAPAPALKSRDVVDNSNQEQDTPSKSDQLEDIQELLAQ